MIAKPYARTPLAFALALACLTYATAVTAQRQAVDLDLAALTAALAPGGSKAVAKTRPDAPAAIALPWFGDTERALVAHEAPQFEYVLQARYPDIRSYRLTAPGSHEVLGRLNVSPGGAFAVIVDADGRRVRLTSALVGGRLLHFLERGAVADVAQACGTHAGDAHAGEAHGGKAGQDARAMTGGCFQLGATLRQYRMALSNTGEYAERTAPGGGTPTVASVNAALNDRLAELNAIYEPEAAITFVLAAGNDALVNLDPATDPYAAPDDGSNDGTNIDNATAEINTTLPVGSYDIGHGLHTKSGGVSGVAAVGVVCQAPSPVPGARFNKASGWSTISEDSPLNILQHEVGHQFSLTHTNYSCVDAADNAPF